MFGYNTDVKSGDTVYHVQTEDRGEKNPVIDSVIYVKGQILDRRRTGYVPGSKTPEELQEMVRNQHGDLVDSIRAGTFVPTTPEKPASPAGFGPAQVELLNPDALERDGRLVFHLRAPSGARVQACLEVDGTETERAETLADEDGVVQVSFRIPGGPRAAVVFRAVGGGSSQTLKFVVHKQ